LIAACSGKLIYKFSGFSTTVIESIIPPTVESSSNGVTKDLNYLYSRETGISHQIYKHSGFSTTVLDSFSGSNTRVVRGLAINGALFCAPDRGRIYHYSGFSSTVLNSFSSPSINLKDVTLDYYNLYSTDNVSDKIYKHSGFSSTLKDYLKPPANYTTALTTNKNNFYSSDAVTRYAYKHAGFSTTILDSFYFNPSIYGFTWD